MLRNSTRVVWILVVTVFPVVLAHTALAQVTNELSGVADVSAVQTEIGGVEQSTLRQRYSANFGHRFTEILRSRAALQFSRFDVDGAQVLGSFEEEIQPSLDILWTPKAVRFYGSGRRRIATSPLTQGDLVTDDVSADLEANIDEYTTLRFYYQRQEVEDTGQEGVRDFFEQRGQASLNWARGSSSLRYLAALQETTNRISGRTTDELSQSLRYLGRMDVGQRVTVDGQYAYQRRDQKSEALTGQTILDPVDARQGLYALDPAPEFGALDAVAGLLDGNVELATDPPIEIGVGAIDQNIGLDFGSPRPVSGLDVYSDRLSGTTLAWQVYVSEDNQDWIRHDELSDEGLPVAIYNPGLQRYEIRFGTIETRYVKVVMLGGNTVSGVLVTEIQPLEALAETAEIERDDSSHRADLGILYRLSPTWRMSLRSSASLEPGAGSLSDRNDVSYELRSSWEATPALIHDVGWQQFWQNFEGSGRDVREDRASYFARYQPMRTIRADAGVSSTFTTTEGERTEERYSGQAGLTIQPLSVWRASTQATASQLRRPELDSRVDTWRLQLSTDAELTPRLQFGANGSYQESRLHPEDRLLVRRTAGLESTFRPFTSATIRGSVRWIRDRRFTRSYDVLVTWNLAERFNFVGQTRIQEGGLESRVDQVSVNYLLSSRARFYLQYSTIDRRGDSQDVVSFSQGYRQSF